MVKHNKIRGIMFILPSLLGLFAFYVIPFLGSLYFTFTSGIAQKKFVYFDNFISLFGNPAYTLAVKNTAMFVGVGVPLLFFLSFLLTLLMMNGTFVIERWALLTPLIVPIAAVVSGWLFIFSDNGLINQMLDKIGFQTISFMGEKYAMHVIIVLFVWKNIGYMTVILTSAVLSLPREYSEVFTMESKSVIKLVFKIILPLISPMVYFVIVISVMNSFKIFRDIYTMFGSDPPKSIYLLQHFMNNNFFKLNYQRLATAAFIFACAIFMLVWFFLKWQNKYSRDL